MREVVTLYDNGDLTGAVERARELVRIRPGMRMALMELAHLELESGNLEAAVEALREAYVLNPADHGTLALLGAYLTQAGNPGGAVEVTGAHSRLAEPDADVLLVRALALARMLQMKDDSHILLNVDRIAPENPMVSVHKGTVYLMAGDREQARGAFVEALVLYPELVAAHTALGIMAIEEGRTDAGVAHWRRAVMADPEQLPRLFAFGIHLWNRGQTSTGGPLLELFQVSAPSDVYQEEISRVRTLLAESGWHAKGNPA